MLTKIIVIITIFHSFSIINVAGRKLIFHWFLSFLPSFFFYQLPEMINEVASRKGSYCSDRVVLYPLNKADLLSFRRGNFKTII